MEGASDGVLWAYVGSKTLLELSHLQGVGKKVLADYALVSGRMDELSVLSDPPRSRLRMIGDDGVDRLTESRHSLSEVDYNYKRLSEEFACETFNDEENLKHLAQLYVIRRELTQEVSRSGVDDRRPQAIRELSQIETAITGLERHLEIDPATRGQKTAQEEASDLVSDLVDTATDYLVDEGVVHLTDHGAAGMTIWYFKADEYMPRCKECGSTEFVFSSPWDDREFPFVVATPQQIADYVAAASFMPSMAPHIDLFDEQWP